MVNPVLYVPSAEWRRGPASDAQVARLKSEGVKVAGAITKGAASDLIAGLELPDDDELQFLAFFGVLLPPSATGLDAASAIGRILEDPSAFQQWEQRPATSDQRAAIKYVDGNVPPALSHRAAAEIVQSYRDNDLKAARLAKHEDQLAARDEREADISDVFDTMLGTLDLYGLTDVTRANVAWAATQLEAKRRKSFSTLVLEDMAIDEKVAELILEANPHLRADRPEQGVTSTQPVGIWKSTRRWEWILFIIAIAGWWLYRSRNQIYTWFN